MRLRSLLLCFGLLSLTLFTAVPAWCDEKAERYIKVLGLDADSLHLEVDGRKLDIPLPDGYEPMSPEKYPDLYEYLFETSEESENIPLCFLVNSEENATIQDGELVNKIILIEILYDFIPKRVSEKTFEEEVNTIKSNHEEFKEWKKLAKRPDYSSYYIYEDSTSIARINIEDEVSSDRKYRIGYSRAWILIEDIVISISFYEDIYTDDNIHSLKKTTLSYIRKLGKE